MAEIIQHIEDLTSLSESIHWFCPRTKGSDDNTCYYDEDVSDLLLGETEEEKSPRQARIEQAKNRKRQVWQACQILAFDGADAQPYHERLKAALKQQLTRCTICVREFHRGRNELRHDLEEQYDEDQVASFMELFDRMNVSRITAGLDSAVATLRDTEPAERTINALPPTEMYALFETMHCMPILQDEALLEKHFDQPFRLVQTRKKISLPEYTPALTAFLFSYNADRSQWALRGWKKSKRTVTGLAFDTTVRETLSRAMGRVNILSLDKLFMPVFWRGVRTIVEKLDQPIIIHHLRAMDVDIYKLALDHLQVDSDCYPDLLGSLRLLLEMAPNDFWDALGTISAQVVIEQILNSPFFDRVMLEGRDPLHVEDMLSWISPLLASIKPATLPPACRALLHQLMTRFQNKAYPHLTSIVCWRTGLRASVSVLQVMLQTTNAGGAAIADLLEIIRGHVSTILSGHDLVSEDKADYKLGLDVVRSALALSCHSLALDRDAIAKSKTLGHDMNISSTAIWKTTAGFVKPDNTSLPASIVAGARKLLTLEPFTSKQIQATAELPKSWNNGLKQIQECLVDVLDRLQDFSSEALREMFDDHEAAQGLFALLFSGEARIQQAATAVLKVASSESSRRESMKFVLEKYYTTSMSSLSYVLKAIARSKSFSPCPTVLKVGSDVLESLCNSQDGILRSKKLTRDEVTWTETFWQSLWRTIGVIFDTTEGWHNIGQEKNMMVEFCKDAMDFADQVFGQYSVIAGALRDSINDTDGMSNLDKRLLETPREECGHVVKWLRLRDDYLIAKAVSITTRIMTRLQDVDMELPEESQFFIQDIISAAVKSKLTPKQKAEMRRALETHLGQTPTGSPEPEVPKAQKQGSLSTWVTAGSGAAPISMERKRQGIDMDAWKSAVRKEDDATLKKTIIGVSPTMEMLKARGDFHKTTAVKATQPPVSANDFRRKRMEEVEAKKKRDAAIVAAAKRTAAGIGDAGSGLAGLGVEGKDHSAKGEGVMVSSDEESDDDDGGLDEELFGIAKKPTKRKDTVRMDAAGAVGLKREQRNVPLRIQKQIRSNKDMRARLAPDLAPLHKTILSWDFFHEGDYPPGAAEYQFKKVAPAFRHPGEYKDTFQPLLTLEAWQSVVRSREEDNSKPYEIKIVNRSSVDAFIELSTSVPIAELKDLQLGDGDVVLLSKAPKPTTSPAAPHCLAKVHRINRRKQQAEIIYRVMPNSSLTSSLTPGSAMYGTKVQSITPLEREYGALSGLQYYDLCDQIIKAQPSNLLEYNDRQLDPLISTYAVNKAQAKAIKSALDNDAFTLIQGPPGSGKTKTIVAIVGALLSETLSAQSVGKRIEIPKGPNNVFSSSAMPTSKKLLVCAPSNAAVDELVMRFKEGVQTVKGIQKKVNVVRLGRSDAINSAVVDVTMDELVSKKLGSVNGDKSAREKTQALMREHKNVSEQLRMTRDQLDGGEVMGSEQSKLQDDLNSLKRRKNELGTQIDSAKDAENAAGRSFDLERKRVQQAVLDEAHVICATLSGSGHDMFQSLNIEFETVVVDEAAQCVEMSALIPLKYGCVKCILVGDPKQLPPTVFSKEAARFQYEQSLFVRMQANSPKDVHLLDTQYRMHPDISSFPSATFYDGRLLDGDGMASLRKKPWHASSVLAPYRFFDVQGQHESAPKGHSLINKAEIEVAICLYERLTKDFADYDFHQKIGIITPYKSQLRELKERFARRFGSTILEAVEFNTTDAFQGRESEIIIFSCVRASPAGSIGFLQDIRRMNVGLTRAKSSLWVLGNSQSLVRGEYWRKLVEDAQRRDCYITGDVKRMLQQPSTRFPAQDGSSVPKRPDPIAANGGGGPGVAAQQVSASVTAVAKKPSSNGTSTGRSTPNSVEPRKAQAAAPVPAPVKSASIDSRMEGVKVKLEDKLTGVRSAHEVSVLRPPANGMHGMRPQGHRPDNDGDVKMEAADTDSRSGGTVTPQDRAPKRPRSETPASGDSTNQAAPAPGVPRKRKPADPFMPKQKAQRRA